MRTLALLALLTLILPGCGGGSGSTGQVFPIVNTDRAGTWSGRETDTVSGQSGTMQLVIGADHRIAGTWLTDAGVNWSITGSVIANPQATSPAYYDAEPIFTISSQVPLDGGGTLQVNGLTGHLIGPIAAASVDPGVGNPAPPIQSLKFTIDLTRQ